MTPGDTARVLALAQSFDNRKVDELVVGAWHTVIGHVEFPDACQAVRDHYARTSDWIMPADVLTGVKRLRADRLERAPYAVPAADPDDVAGYLADLRAQRHRQAEGLTARPMVTLASGQRVLAIAAETAEQMPAMPKPGYAPPPAELVERFRRSLPRRRRARDLTYAEAMADLDVRAPEPAPEPPAVSDPPSSLTEQPERSTP